MNSLDSFRGRGGFGKVTWYPSFNTTEILALSMLQERCISSHRRPWVLSYRWICQYAHRLFPAFFALFSNNICERLRILKSRAPCPYRLLLYSKANFPFGPLYGNELCWNIAVWNRGFTYLLPIWLRSIFEWKLNNKGVLINEFVCIITVRLSIFFLDTNSCNFRFCYFYQ